MDKSTGEALIDMATALKAAFDSITDLQDACRRLDLRVKTLEKNLED